MSEELDVLKAVTQRLNGANIPYMLSGSLAANYYATPRMSRDIDLVVDLQAKDIDPFVSLFANDFYADRDDIAEAVAVQGMFNLIHNQYVLKVDFIIKKDSPYRKVEFERRQKVSVEDFPLWIVSPEDLILSKLWWSKDSFSEMQAKDIQNLLQTVQELDQTYIDKWVAHLELQEVYNKARTHL